MINLLRVCVVAFVDDDENTERERLGERERERERSVFFSFLILEETFFFFFYKSSFHTLKICILFAKQIATQSGAAADHCRPQISAPAE